jgi:carbamoyltransferase
MHILGLSAFSHDSAAALLSEKGVEAAIEEGKLTRSRYGAGIPREAIRFCLERGKIGWRDVDLVAIGGQPVQAWLRRAMLRAGLTPVAPLSSGYYQSKALGDLGRDLNNVRILKQMYGAPRGRVVELDHHLCHAASAFYPSSFDRALIVTMDEQGDGRSGLVALGEGAGIRRRQRIPFPHSLAWVYSQVTELIGFHPHEDEHKTQWLSLTGQPVYKGVFVEMFRRGSSAALHLNTRFFNPGLSGRIAFSAEFYKRLGISEKPQQVPAELRANLASSIQHACADLVGHFVESLRQRTDTRYLCLAGGLFLNALLVAALEKNTGFDKIFVQPAAGNEGTALGAAWLAQHTILDQPRTAPMGSLYWGPSYTNEQIKQVLDNCKATYHWMDSETRKTEEALRLLKAGRIVAWSQGAAEFGPRALGNRSLLASPWSPYVKENLNDFVKHRESFRPFALSVPEEDCARYFECSELGRYMVTMGTARPEFREMLAAHLLPGGLVRLHIVTRARNPQLWRLLRAFGAEAPAPLLVNTSFNLFGEPLVVSPRDALRSFYCSGADALVLGDFLLTKASAQNAQGSSGIDGTDRWSKT